MKSEFNNTNINILKFPFLAECKSGKFIILFTAHNKGTVVYEPDIKTGYGLGAYRDDWTNVYDENVWRVLGVGQVVLLTQ